MTTQGNIYRLCDYAPEIAARSRLGYELVSESANERVFQNGNGVRVIEVLGKPSVVAQDERHQRVEQYVVATLEGVDTALYDALEWWPDRNTEGRTMSKMMLMVLVFAPAMMLGFMWAPLHTFWDNVLFVLSISLLLSAALVLGVQALSAQLHVAAARRKTVRLIRQLMHDHDRELEHYLNMLSGITLARSTVRSRAARYILRYL